MEELLLPVEELARFLRHESPVIRKWAWERLKDIHPRETEIALAALKEERDYLVLEHGLHFFRETGELSSEVKEKLKEFLLTRLEIEENKKLMVSVFAVLSRVTSLKTVVEERPHLLEKVMEDEMAGLQMWERVIFTLPPEEMAPFMDLLDDPESRKAWEAFYAGYRVWTTADPAPVKEVYLRLREHLPKFLDGLPAVLSEDEYFLKILPEEVRDRWKNLSRKSEREKLRAFVEEEFRKLREEVIDLRGEIALRRHLERPESLGPVFRSLEVLLEVSRGDASEPVVRTLGRLLLTLLWGKPLLGLSENPSRETLYELYFDEDRPFFPEDSTLREKILDLVEKDPSVVEEVRERLRKVFRKDSYGAERGVDLARKCGETFLEELLELYRTSVKEDFEEDEYIKEALRDFLPLERVRDELRKLARDFRRLDPFYLLAHYPDRTTAGDLARDFEMWLEEDHDALSWLTLCFPHPELWERVKALVHPETPAWPEAFVVLARLFEPDFPGLERLEKRVREKELQLWKALYREEKLDPSGEELTLALRCLDCRYLFPFSPRVIVINAEDHEVDLPERVRCPRCRAEDLFEIPEREKIRAGARLLLLKKDGEEDEWEKEVIYTRGFRLLIAGSERTFRSYREVLSFYRARLERDPGNPEILSGYLHLLLRGRRLEEAEEVLERLGRASPESVDHFYLRAIYHRLREDPEKALEFYRKALEAVALGKPLYRFHPPDRKAILRDIFGEARAYARKKGLPFHFEEIQKRPIRKVGRNDPCPCGSGKKYKKCCMRKEEAAAEKKTAQSAAEKRAFNLYEGFVARKYKRELRAFLEKWMERFEEVLGERGEGVDGATALGEIFLFTASTPEGRPLSEEFLRTKGRNLSREEREILASLSRSYPSLFEVLEVDEERGELAFRDLFTGETLRVRDYSLAKNLGPTERVWTMLFRVRDYFRPCRIGFPVNLFKSPKVLSRMKQILGDPTPEEYPDRARRKAAELLLEVLRILTEPVEFRLITPEGDEVVVARAHYRLLVPEVEERFPTGSFHRIEEHRYALLEKTPESAFSTAGLPSSKEAACGTLVVQSRVSGGYTEVGTVEFRPERERVVLEAMSRARLERLRRAFEEVAGDGVKFLVEEIVDWRKAAGEGPETEREEIPDHEAADLRWLEYLVWLETPEPEWGGKTPREAFRDPALRPKVEEKLRHFELLEKGFRRKGRVAVDIRKLRSMLEAGLTD